MKNQPTDPSPVADTHTLDPLEVAIEAFDEAITALDDLITEAKAALDDAATGKGDDCGVFAGDALAGAIEEMEESMAEMTAAGDELKAEEGALALFVVARHVRGYTERARGEAADMQRALGEEIFGGRPFAP